MSINLPFNLFSSPFALGAYEMTSTEIFPFLIISVVIVILTVYMLQNRNKNFYGLIVLSKSHEGIKFPIKNGGVSYAEVAGKLNMEFKSDFDSKKVEFTLNERGCVIYDNNPRPSMSVNNHKLRKAYVNDGDLINLGGVKLIFINDKDSSHKKIALDNTRKYNGGVKGKYSDSLPVLLSLDSKRKKIPLSKNLTYIGKSDSNDVVVKITGIGYRHALIKKISDSCYKIF